MTVLERAVRRPVVWVRGRLGAPERGSATAEYAVVILATVALRKHTRR
jgi:hypothetical protein